MSALVDAIEALEAVIGAYLPTWNGYAGSVLEVSTPAYIVGVPTEAHYDAAPQARARYILPVTLAVDVDDGMALADVLSGDTLPAELAGATNEGWWGSLTVPEARETRTAPNGSGVVLVADLTVIVYA